MSRDRAEKLGALFLAIFSTGLCAQLAIDGGLAPSQWLGGVAASLGSIALAVAVHVWPHPQAAEARARRD
jgi:hypothetical protein